MNKPEFAVLGESGGTSEGNRNTAIFIVVVVIVVTALFAPLVEESPQAQADIQEIDLEQIVARKKAQD